MQPESALPFQPNVSLGLLLTLAVLFGAFFVVLSVLRHSPQTAHASAKLSVFVAVLVVAVIVLMKFARTDTSHRIQVEDSRMVAESTMRRVDLLSSGDSPRLEASESDAAKPNAELPEWTRQTSRVEGANTFVVVKSGRFATPEEAELHAFDEAGQAAARHFRNLDPSGIGRCLPMQRELVRESGIRDRSDEISRHDLGTMKNFPMHQVWLQVKLNPQFGERFAEPWRQAAVAVRLRMLTHWSIWGTAAAALIAFSLRLDAAWNGRRRAAVAGTTIALMLGSLAFIAVR